MILGTFSFLNQALLQNAKATYVEGSIIRDTVWLLVDNPIIISNNVVVYPGVTLTIEPGVEVRFGGLFSVSVMGKLLADGTDAPIKFISNMEDTRDGDWDTIRFGGTEKSVLKDCFVAHGTNGILVENGDVEIYGSNITLCSENGINVINGKLKIQESKVGSCSRNGINATDSELIVKDNTIIGNGGNGIALTGSGQTTIQDNIVIANKNGVLLSGNNTSNVDLSHNTIAANEQNGIQLGTNTHTNLQISYNNVSSNYIGFNISSSTGIYTTENSIAQNYIGVLCGKGDHTVYNNDIYDNSIGMNVESDSTVNAEYNYWGDESGPYHISLNPSGKGNPVGGDGTNLDFIFFLTEPFGYINTRPTANLLTDKNTVSPNETVMFFATNSSDERRIDRYFFDFGDGNTSDWTTLSVFTHKYSALGIYSASVMVMDDFGAISTNNADVMIDVRNLPALYVHMEVGDSVISEEEQVLINVQVKDGSTPIENSEVKIFSIRGGSFEDSTGYTNSTGYFTTTFTASDVAHITNVRIVATASHSGYTDGSAYKYLEVSPLLSVVIEADSDLIISEEKTQITVYVKSDEQPVTGATVSISSDSGKLSTTTGITDSEGTITLEFTAPQTIELVNVNVTATATKTGYLSGAGLLTITTQPKILVVQIITETGVAISEEQVEIAVHVKYHSPIKGAIVTVTAENGNFSSITESTDSNGNASFLFTAPQVLQQSNITITARATKAEYAVGEKHVEIIVNPRTFNITTEVTPETVESQDTATINVHVTCTEDATPVANATIAISCNEGYFSSMEQTTDSEGYCSFVFNAPTTTVQITSIIVVNATKNGYFNGGSQTMINVTPATYEQAEGGWPITMVLLILIPIVVAVIVVVLVKLKIISLSTEE